MLRISPACAGNTPPSRPDFRALPDQPRVRGEHCTTGLQYGCFSGSAPRARGTPVPRDKNPGRDRISPACAGNTIDHDSYGPDAPDQPRVRGEHLAWTQDAVVSDGSAPRARGTRRSASGCARSPRISPACAGNTPGPSGMESPRSDQPRVRGEHPRSTFRKSSSAGSAPRARGTLRVAVSYRVCERISPACAGNTCPSAARPRN